MVPETENVPRELPSAHSLSKEEIDVGGDFVALRSFLCGEIQYRSGDDFVRTSVTTRTLRQLYEQNFIAPKLKAKQVRYRKTKES